MRVAHANRVRRSWQFGQPCTEGKRLGPQGDCGNRTCELAESSLNETGLLLRGSQGSRTHHLSISYVLMDSGHSSSCSAACLVAGVTVHQGNAFHAQGACRPSCLLCTWQRLACNTIMNIQTQKRAHKHSLKDPCPLHG